MNKSPYNWAVVFPQQIPFYNQGSPFLIAQTYVVQTKGSFLSASVMQGIKDTPKKLLLSVPHGTYECLA